MARGALGWGVGCRRTLLLVRRCCVQVLRHAPHLNILPFHSILSLLVRCLHTHKLNRHQLRALQRDRLLGLRHGSDVLLSFMPFHRVNLFHSFPSHGHGLLQSYGALSGPTLKLALLKVLGQL